MPSTHSHGRCIADELGLHSMLGCKGSSGLKPCMMCANVFLRRETRHVVASDGTGMAVHHTEADHRRLIPATPEFLDKLLDRLEAGSTQMTATDFNELQTRLGWNYDPGMRYRLRRVQPTSTVCFDWMHCIFVNGIFQIHMGALMKVLKQVDITYHTLEQYVSQWGWPRRMRSPDSVFEAKRARSSWDAEVLKCSASEGLSLLPVSQCGCALADATPQHCYMHRDMQSSDAPFSPAYLCFSGIGKCAGLEPNAFTIACCLMQA